MKALYFNGKELRERRLPKPRGRRGEVIVKVHLAGICSTDIEILRGYMSFKGVPGHEFVGTVVSTSPRKLAGKCVVGEINVPCGRCSICRRGLGKHCPKRSVLGIEGRNGAFAEYLSLPVDNLHVVPAGISDEEAVFTELLAAACDIPWRITIPSGCRVAVLGDGRLAAMAAQVVSLKTKRVEVIGTSAAKLAVIRKSSISTHKLDHAGRFKRSFDIVVECTGSPDGLPLAAELVRPQGTIVLKSTYSRRLQWNPAPLVIDEITVVGSRCGPFENALRLLAFGEVDVKPYLTAVYPMDRWREAFRRAKRRDSFKVCLRMP